MKLTFLLSFFFFFLKKKSPFHVFLDNKVKSKNKWGEMLRDVTFLPHFRPTFFFSFFFVGNFSYFYNFFFAPLKRKRN